MNKYHAGPHQKVSLETSWARLWAQASTACWSMSLYSARVAVSHWVRNKSALQGRRMPSVFLGCCGKVQPSGAWGEESGILMSARGSVSLFAIPPVNRSQEMNRSSCLPGKSYSDIGKCSVLLPPVLLKIVLIQVLSTLWDLDCRFAVAMAWERSRVAWLNVIRMTFTRSPWWEVLNLDVAWWWQEHQRESTLPSFKLGKCFVRLWIWWFWFRVSNDLCKLL